MAIGSRASAFWERIGPRARDLVFILIATLSAIGVSFADFDSALIQLLVLFIGLIGAVALWWRRRHPLAVTIVGVAVLALTQAPTVLGIGLFSLAIRRRDRVLGVMTVCAAAGIALVSGLDASGDDWIGPIIGGILGAGFSAAAGSYIGARRDLVDSLRERAERAEEERELRAEQAKLGERARIAREMHDVLAHKVSLIALHAGALEVSTSVEPEQVQRTAGLIRTTAREAMEDLRDVLGVLRSGGDVDDADLSPQPRAADIERVVEASRAAGVHADLTMNVGELPDAVARSAYRVVREGLTNVHKHARGAATSVMIGGDELSGITVEVINQRPVSSAALLPGSGAGLLGLQERVSLLGGRLESGPLADGGWRLCAWMPWPAGHTASVGAAPA